MINLSSEQVLSLADAAKRLPGRPHISTIWRWTTRGTKYGKLESTIIGGYRYTSVEALQRFADRATAAANGEAVPVRSSRQREKAIAAAETELASLGV